MSDSFREGTCSIFEIEVVRDTAIGKRASVLVPDGKKPKTCC